MSTSEPRVEVLYFDGCPNYRQAITLLQRALDAEGIAVAMRLIRVETERDAVRLDFYGSPTIRIDGRDVAPVPVSATPSLACRVYPTRDGRLAPVPAYEALVAALRQRSA